MRAKAKRREQRANAYALCAMRDRMIMNSGG